MWCGRQINFISWMNLQTDEICYNIFCYFIFILFLAPCLVMKTICGYFYYIYQDKKGIIILISWREGGMSIKALHMFNPNKSPAIHVHPFFPLPNHSHEFFLYLFIFCFLWDFFTYLPLTTSIQFIMDFPSFF